MESPAGGANYCLGCVSDRVDSNARNGYMAYMSNAQLADPGPACCGSNGHFNDGTAEGLGSFRTDMVSLYDEQLNARKDLLGISHGTAGAIHGASVYVPPDPCSDGEQNFNEMVRKRAFRAIVILQTECLPRQARDKHGKRCVKRCFKRRRFCRDLTAGGTARLRV